MSVAALCQASEQLAPRDTEAAHKHLTSAQQRLDQAEESVAQEQAYFSSVDQGTQMFDTWHAHCTAYGAKAARRDALANDLGAAEAALQAAVRAETEYLSRRKHSIEVRACVQARLRAALGAGAAFWACKAAAALWVLTERAAAGAGHVPRRGGARGARPARSESERACAWQRICSSCDGLFVGKPNSMVPGLWSIMSSHYEQHHDSESDSSGSGQMRGLSIGAQMQLRLEEGLFEPGTQPELVQALQHSAAPAQLCALRLDQRHLISLVAPQEVLRAELDEVGVGSGGQVRLVALMATAMRRRCSCMAWSELEAHLTSELKACDAALQRAVVAKLFDPHLETMMKWLWRPQGGLVQRQCAELAAKELAPPGTPARRQ